MDAIIIDDEAKGRLALRQKISDHCPTLHIVAEASNGEEGIKLIEQYKPKVIFLDIEMPKLNGFDMLSKINQKEFQVIFTTAYDQYAIKAIKYAAFDYLLKPVDIEELKQAVDRVTNTAHVQTVKQSQVLQQNLSQPKNNFNKLGIATHEGLLFFEIEKIVHLEASSNYTNIYFSDNSKINVSKTLKDFEELLPTDLFFRIHHSHLINLNFIKRYIRGDGGQIELINGNFIDVSRRKKEEFLKVIGY